MELTEKQKHVLYHIVKDIKEGKKEVILKGVGGSGKSTLLKFLAKFFPNFLVVAYTGKAASVLRRKGVDHAKTIHSSVYQPVYENNQLVAWDMVNKHELGDGFLVDEACLPYKQKIVTEDGSQCIGTIVNQRKPVRVFSYNFVTRQIELKKITNWFRYERKSSILTIKASSKQNLERSIRCTPNHQIYLGDGTKVQAGNLQVGNDLLFGDYKDHGVLSIVSIDTWQNKEKYVYDIEVEDNHNYFANNVLVSNSMVSKEIYQDLTYYQLPIVFVGDHAQLEPIGSDFNLMKKPGYTLEEIHRNAGDIAKFAERLRFGYTATFSESEKVKFIHKPTSQDLASVDQVICAFNRTRVATNNQIRAELGFSGLLNIGERIICLKNNKTLGIFNGMQGIVRNIYECQHTGRKLIDFEAYDCLYSGIWYDTKQFGQEKINNFNYTEKIYPNPFDYAYCITAHKAIGDEFDKVLVIEQKCAKWEHKRWAYTAASRAKQQLIWSKAC